MHALFAVANVCVVCFILKYCERGLQCSSFQKGAGLAYRSVLVALFAVAIKCGICYLEKKNRKGNCSALFPMDVLECSERTVCCGK